MEKIKIVFTENCVKLLVQNSNENIPKINRNWVLCQLFDKFLKKSDSDFFQSDEKIIRSKFRFISKTHVIGRLFENFPNSQNWIDNRMCQVLSLFCFCGKKPAAQLSFILWLSLVAQWGLSFSFSKSKDQFRLGCRCQDRSVDS